MWAVVAIICVLFSQSVVNVVSNPNPISGVYFALPRESSPPGAIFVRLLGVALFGLAMFMVLVAQKIEAVWWWSWAFVISDTVAAGVVILHLAFGLPNRSPTLVWWIAVVLCLGFSVAVLWGLFKAHQDQPFIEA
jgi:hypothetical protein